jgi:PAS domain S-box-containing protein
VGVRVKVVIMITEDQNLLEEIRSLIPDKYYLIGSSDVDFSRVFINDLSRGLVLLDTDCQDALNWLKDGIANKPGLTCIGVGKDNKQAQKVIDFLYDFLPVPFEQWQLNKILDRAWEKTINETGGTAARHEKPTSGMKVSQKDYDLTSRPWARVLSDFSRTVSNQLNREKFINLFIYAVKELIPVTKLAVLLRDNAGNEFIIASQQGLEPEINTLLRLKDSEGVVAWLTAEGQILQRPELSGSIPAEHRAEILQEMKMLHAHVCVPLIAQGKLNGVLCLGSKLAGAPFYDRELELLYTVCGNIAVALDDIDLHEHLVNQKIYIESILQLMDSGVVAIDRSERITTFNQRAGEILKHDPAKMVNADLRALISPLGDLLYETMLTGNAYYKKFLELTEGKVPLEISTYRMVNQYDDVLGSVMIIDDITSRKLAEAERNKVEQINVLNRFVSQLTHEIKNPMVAIQTFAQLLPEKYEDQEFRMIFSQTVKQEVKRLNEQVDQLIAFSTPLNYQYEIVDIHEVIEQSIALLKEQGGNMNGLIQKSICPGQARVKVDRLSMARAIAYLISFLNEGIPGKDKEVTIVTALPDSKYNPDQIHIMITDNCTKIDFDNLERIFNPLEVSPDNTISIGVPVSRKIVEDHGGTLQAAQANGSPLKFGISLPLYTS